MEKCILAVLVTATLVGVAYQQVCSEVSGRGLYDDDLSIRDSLQNILDRLNSSLVVRDVLTSGNGSDKTVAEVTVLSHLIDIGTIPASGYITKKDPETYLRWLEIYKAIQNPVVFFTEKYTVARRMLYYREKLPTVVIIIEKYSTWAFGLLSKHTEIYEDKDYPKYYPNTMFPEYACVTHAKCEFLRILSHWNYFQTDDVAWVDVGIFRSHVDAGDFRPFILRRLPGLSRDKVTINYIRDPKRKELNHRYIMKNSISIFSASYWIGETQLLKTFTSEYINYVEILLGEGLANCDEQVLATMFVEGTHFKPEVQVEVFRADAYKNCDRWFCLGHKTREAGLI